MRRLGTIDLEVLDLAVEKNGTFDENSLENSGLKRLGVGRILDALASLKDRKLISLNEDGSFSITDVARGILWSSQVPTWARILRLLQIRSCSAGQIASILRIPEAEVEDGVEELRKNQLILMSPQRREDRLVKVYEILPDGAAVIDKAETDGFDRACPRRAGPEAETLGIIDEVIRDVEDSCMGQSEKDTVTKKLSGLKDKLRI